MKTLLIATLLLTTGCTTMADKFAKAQLYPMPGTEVPAPPEGWGEVYADGHHMWLLDQRSDKTIIFAKGNGMNLGSLSGLIPLFEATGANVVLFEYPGYGKAKGEPSERSLVGAMRVALHEAKTNFKARKIYFWGWSLGAAVATIAAKGQDISGLIVMSGWTNFQEVARHHTSFADRLSEAFLKEHGYYTDRVAPDITVPVLQIHGVKDELIPIELGRRLKFPDREFVEVDHGHNDIFGWNGLLTKVKGFIE